MIFAVNLRDSHCWNCRSFWLQRQKTVFIETLNLRAFTELPLGSQPSVTESYREPQRATVNYIELHWAFSCTQFESNYLMACLKVRETAKSSDASNFEVRNDAQESLVKIQNLNFHLPTTRALERWAQALNSSPAKAGEKVVQGTEIGISKKESLIKKYSRR